MTKGSKQATVVAVSYVLLIGVIAVVALREYDVDEFLKVWAVLGTLVGVLTGAIPAYFFAVAADQAKQAQAKSDELTRTVLGVADVKLLEKAKEIRPDLFS